MASAQANELFNCTNEEFFKIITDFDKYHEFLSEVKKCQVVKTEGTRKMVEYTVSVMKEFKYNLWMTEQAPNSLTWELASGDLFKTSSGSWKLSDENGKTRAVYSVDATFNMFVPGPIAKALVAVNLPNMMAAYTKRVKQVYGK
jgi:coenzyme Q-binding protein COQ10